MTSPIAPTNISALGTPPSTSDPVNFDSRADAFLGQLPTLVTETNAASAATYQNAVSANESATACLSAVTTTGENKEDCEAALASTVAAKDAAQDYEEAANSSKIDAIAAKDLAQAAANQVDVAGALAGLPPRVGSELKVVRVKADGTGFEYVEYIQRLHVLSAAASAKNAVGGMLPIFDSTTTIPNALAASERLLCTGDGFLVGPTRGTEFYATSPGGSVWTERYLGFGVSFALPRNNGANVILANGSSAHRSSDGGIIFVAGADIGRVPTFAAYASSGTYLAGSANLCRVSTNNGVSFSADQTIPISATNVFAVGTTFVAYNSASGTYHTSTTGLTGGWISRTLPSAIAAGTIWEDGAGGLVLVPTDVAKNLYGTSDGINWVDLGFNQSSLNYGGLSDGTKNVAAFVCPVKINGNWVLFNGATAGAAGAGAAVKYKGDTWVPMFVDVSDLANSVATKLLVASKGAGVTVVRAAGVTNKVHLINTTTTKCMGCFI